MTRLGDVRVPPAVAADLLVVVADAGGIHLVGTAATLPTLFARTVVDFLPFPLPLPLLLLLLFLSLFLSLVAVVVVAGDARGSDELSSTVALERAFVSEERRFAERGAEKLYRITVDAEQTATLASVVQKRTRRRKTGRRNVEGESRRRMSSHAMSSRA